MTISRMNELLEYANDKQKEYLNAAIACNGRWTKAGVLLGISESTIRLSIKRLDYTVSKAGFDPEGSLQHKAPAGFSIDRVSSFLDDEGKVQRQWVIANRDKEDQFNAMADAITNLCQMAEGKYTSKAKKILSDKDMLTTYIIGDQHHSMLSWHEETGDDYDMNKSETLLKNAVSYLTEATRATEQCLIVNCGDWFHGNDHSNRTPKSGNALDVDGRLTKIIRTGMMLMVSVIEKCLEKHDTVNVRNALGNHSFTLEMFMSEFLVAWFRNEPRVIIHNEPRPFWYYKFGQTLLGVTHGDTIRPTDLGELMAAECHDIWSDTTHRYWLLGHVHSKHSWELRTCIAESFNTLAAKDAWHNEHGYRSKRNMAAITYHLQYGEVSRNTVDIGAIS
jgi:hypothetical protein